MDREYLRVGDVVKAKLFGADSAPTATSTKKRFILADELDACGCTFHVLSQQSFTP
jgi:hypothetical protein